MARAPAAASARPSASRGRGRRWRSTGPWARPSSTARPAAAAPRSPVTPTRSPGCAPSRPTSSSSAPAQPTTVHRDRERRSGHEVAARDRDPAVGGQRLGAGVQLQHVVVGELRRKHDRQIRLARLGAHRGEVRQRPRQRPVAGVARRPAAAEPEVRAVDHHVGRHRRHSARAHHRAVVADPAQHARAGPPLERGRDRLYETQFPGGAQRDIALTEWPVGRGPTYLWR